VTPLPAALARSPELIGWRLDWARHAAVWSSGEGARIEGGRWNSVGRRAVYCSLDPATTILERAVHTGFAMLDTVAHVLTSVRIEEPKAVHVVSPEDVPNANWLRAGFPSAGQQGFGDALLASHLFIVIPSVVSTHSWNLIFDPTRAEGAYTLVRQEPFALDTRLHRPVKAT
jgi:RES domain-containing protein